MPSVNVNKENRERFIKYGKPLESQNVIMTRILDACEIIQKLSLPNEDLLETANRVAAVVNQKEERATTLRTTVSVV